MGILNEGKFIVFSKKAQRSLICCGYGYDAEVGVDRVINGKLETFYITCRAYEGMYYGVSKQSIFDEEDDSELEFLEEYFSLRDAQKSDFAQFFEMADKMLDEIDAA